MKNLKLALMGTALASVLATSAIAGDCSFSGFYLGAQLGAGTTNTEVKFAQPRIAATANRSATIAITAADDCVDCSTSEQREIDE